MKQRAFIANIHMASALGTGREAHLSKLTKSVSGIAQHTIGTREVYAAAIKKESILLASARSKSTGFTFFESLAIHAIESVLHPFYDRDAIPEIPLFFATTKGNIDHIQSYSGQSDDKLHIVESINKIQQYFSWSTQPLTICNACTSGLMALIMASRMIKMGQIDAAIVCGVDVLSEFTIEGFSALQALDPASCKPFDKDRSGINLGEGAAALLLTNESSTAKLEILGAGIANDANHISGPSRTGEGLKRAIKSALLRSDYPTIDFINAHGTATLYNDEMEGQAFHGLELANTPTNSFKGYWGHTLGAAGLLELGGSILSLETNTMFASAGYEDHGLTVPLAIARTTQDMALNTCLKTSSGFGGSNAAVVIQKH